MKPSITSIQTQLKRDEGVVLKPYKDTVGKTTIGVGRNLDDVGITLYEADVMLQNDIDKIQRALSVGYPWFDKLMADDPIRASVLINMGFNMGFIGLAKFVHFLQFVESRDWESAANEMLNSAWAKQVGSRAIRLSTQMRLGQWT